MEIPEAAIEVGAKAIFERNRPENYEPWDGGAGIMLSDEDRDAYREDARSTLQAALPALRDQWREEVEANIDWPAARHAFREASDAQD